MHSLLVLVELSSGVLTRAKVHGTLRVNFCGIMQDRDKNLNAPHLSGIAPVSLEDGGAQRGNGSVGGCGPL